MENGIIGILTGILFILTISEFTDSCNMKFNIKKIFKGKIDSKSFKSFVS